MSELLEIRQEIASLQVKLKEAKERELPIKYLIELRRSLTQLEEKQFRISSTMSELLEIREEIASLQVKLNEAKERELPIKYLIELRWSLNLLLEKELMAPAPGSDESLLKQRDYEEFKAIISEATSTLQMKISTGISAEISTRVSLHDRERTYTAVVQSLKCFADDFVENFSHVGQSLFESDELEAIVNKLPDPQDGRRNRGAVLCQLMYSPLRRKLTQALPPGYVMIDSELFASFPPNLKDAEEMKNLKKWYRPDFLILPSFMAEFVKLKQAKISDNDYTMRSIKSISALWRNSNYRYEKWKCAQ